MFVMPPEEAVPPWFLVSYNHKKNGAVRTQGFAAMIVSPNTGVFNHV
jgi:hypothetical protein